MGQTGRVDRISSATGSVTVQIAKHIVGAKVVAITGSDSKGDFVRGLGADIALYVCSAIKHF
jgi:NADPH-dependent curcumin reductase CurA